MKAIRIAVAVFLSSSSLALAQDASTEPEAPAADTTRESVQSTDAAAATAQPEAEAAPEADTAADETPATEGAAPEAAPEISTDAPPTVELPTGGETGSVLSLDEEAPPPPVVLERIPPRFSYEFGVHASYGTIATFIDAVPFGWVGLGLRAGWGKNFGRNRIGPGLVLAFEGPIPIHWSFALEPQVQWDHVTLKGFAVGASVAPSLLVNTGDNKGTTETSTHFAPALAFRIGYSETWSRVGRRFFIYLEPRLRYVVGAEDTRQALNPLVAIVIGSGRGY